MPGNRKRTQPEVIETTNNLIPVPNCITEPPTKRIHSNSPRSAMSSPNVEQHNKVDEDLYSRQLGAYGMETMGKLIRMRVLVIGLNGTGAEVCKNLCLAGPKAISICDDEPIRGSDLGSNFFYKANDIGKKKSDVVLPKLAELNDYVRISQVARNEISAEMINANFDTVVLCGYTYHESIMVNEMTREAAKLRGSSIPFISACASGLTASIFSDFGDHHLVHDKNGENEKNGIIQSIVREGDELTVSLIEDKLNPFGSGDSVTFDEVEGMSQLNGHSPFTVQSVGKHTVKISVSGLSEQSYQGGGIIKQVKVPHPISHLSLKEALDEPTPEGMFATPDLSLFDRPGQLHMAFRGVAKFSESHNRLPGLRNEDDYNTVLASTKSLLEDLKSAGKSWVPEEIDDEVVRYVSMLAETEISPLASFAGGVAAQEIVKATGKFMPLNQFLHLDYFHMMKEFPAPLSVPLEDERYRDMKAIFGTETFEKLQSAKIFLVGAGALGCEFLKMFSLMGMCSNERGKLTVTDMDTIENSNLNRQFLFRKNHIGEMKSAIAGAAAHEMNPDFRVAATQTRVGQDTEDFFDDRFWTELDVVVNALDNVESRLYVDNRCVWYGKPLMESGTLGTKCNSQVVIPFLTESYGDSQDPPEESIPLCTLKNFPYLIDHCLQWSRDTFQGVFADVPDDLELASKDFNSYEEKVRSTGFPKMQIERVNNTRELLELAREPTVEKAVERAVILFMKLHNFPLKQLIHNFPADHVTSEGVKFWSGTKRFPNPLEFSQDDQIIRGFISAAARIYANIVKFDRMKSVSDDELMVVASKIKVPEFHVDSSTKIQINDDEPAEQQNDDHSTEDEAKLAEVLETLKNEVASGVAVEPEAFEKDDDSNHHIDFVHAAGNLRARNYSIKECARHESKMIAGKIIPALATTTAMITGIVSLEMLKTFDKTRPIEDYRNSFMNIAIPVWILSEPMPAKKQVDVEFDPVVCGPLIARPSGFTVWDKTEIQQTNCTVQQLVDSIEEKYNVDVSVISYGPKMLYMSYMPGHKSRLPRPVVDIIAEISGTPVDPKCKSLPVDVACNDKDSGDEVTIPTVKLSIA